MVGSQKTSQRLLSAELRAGEGLIWYDRPSAGTVVWPQFVILAFMLIWTGFAASWTSMAFLVHAHEDNVGFLSLFPLFGVPMVIIGLITVLSVSWKLLCLYSTYYGLTDRRVIIMVRVWPGRTDSYDASWIRQVDRTENGELGTLTLSGPYTEDGREKVHLNNLAESVDVEAAIRKWLLKG